MGSQQGNIALLGPSHGLCEGRPNPAYRPFEQLSPGNAMSDNAHYVKSRALSAGSAGFRGPTPLPPAPCRLLCSPPHKYFPIFLDTPMRMRYRFRVINVTGVSDVEAF